MSEKGLFVTIFWVMWAVGISMVWFVFRGFFESAIFASITGIIFTILTIKSKSY